MKKFLLTFTLIYAMPSWATPEKVEIIFLSEPKTTSYIEQKVWHILGQVAQNDWKKDCVPTGDGCFHPQMGYVPSDGPERPADAGPAKPLKTFNALETDMIDCREEEYFDIFCGKAKKEATKLADVEIWVDTSSSLRKMDFSTEPSRCVRRSFVESLQRECGDGKLAIQTYDTSIKTLGSLEGLCQNYGTNDVSRLIDWIKGSKVKYLLIVTDIDELSTELRDFLDSIGATYHGSGTKDVTVKDLQSYVSVVKKHCK